METYINCTGIIWNNKLKGILNELLNYKSVLWNKNTAFSEKKKIFASKWILQN